MQELINGLAIGSIYALVTSGLLLIFGILEVPDFALGARLMVGTYVAVFVVLSLEFPYWVGVVASMLTAAVLGIVGELLVYRQLRRASALAGFIGALALSTVLVAAVTLVKGTSFRQLPSPYEDSVTTIAGASVSQQRVIAGAIAIALLVGLHVFLRFAPGGRAMRAVMEDRSGAVLVGISPNRIAIYAVAAGSGLAGIAGGLIAPIYLVYPTMGDAIVIKAFIVMILAGMRSSGGVIAVALGLGLVESFATRFISAGWTDAYAFFVLIICLALRPNGLFSRSMVAR